MASMGKNRGLQCLSQRGSYNLARLGWSAARILEFYYPGTTIQTIDDSIVFWQESN